jgi:hypothetical protein
MCRACSCHPVCRHLAPTLPTSRHVCSTRDACSRHPMRHPVTLLVCRRSCLSSSRDSRQTPPTPLCSHHALVLPRRRTPLLQALTIPHRSHAPLHHAMPAAEPPSAASNRRSTEPAASFGCRGRLPIERHLRPPTCSSVTAATSARAHRQLHEP